MPELEDDGPGRTCRDSPTAPPSYAAAAAPGESIMYLDLDVYSPWPTMDQQLPFGAFLSASNQPSSPLWALSCGFEDKLAPHPGRRRGPPLRLLSIVTIQKPKPPLRIAIVKSCHPHIWG
ncbi:uncharacterized protein LOC108959932 [Eucalyptus grandis]|uniref:uncharacterized protein LOC108959932 n=1 Tax=Eucalyptus grandis TaxID=71139 RepID=UPI00192EAB01|nr:uncharacterized protein LOC108959932 [Eucalyptus grandis]